MLVRARQEADYPIEHSTRLTEDGEAWRQKVGVEAAERIVSYLNSLRDPRR